MPRVPAGKKEGAQILPRSGKSMSSGDPLISAQSSNARLGSPEPIFWAAIESNHHATTRGAYSTRGWADRDGETGVTCDSGPPLTSTSRCAPLISKDNKSSLPMSWYIPMHHAGTARVLDVAELDETGSDYCCDQDWFRAAAAPIQVQICGQ